MKARDAAKYLQYTGKPSTSLPSTTKNYPPSNITCAKCEKLWDLAIRFWPSDLNGGHLITETRSLK